MCPQHDLSLDVDLALSANLYCPVWDLACANPEENVNPMKILLLSFLLASVPALTAAGDGPSLSGTWQIHNNIAGNESDRACTFVQNGDNLTGSCPSERGEVKLNGQVKGKTVSWSYRSEYEGSPITVKYEGTLQSETKITGTVNVAEYGADGDFTATLSK
jgi:hypothetical protein